MPPPVVVPPSYPRPVVSSSPPRNQKPEPFPETVVRSSLGGGGVAATTRFPPPTSAAPVVRRPSPLPGDIITELKMEVGAGGRGGLGLPRRDDPALVGRGSSLLSRTEGVAAGPVSVPRSLERSNSVLDSRPSDLLRGWTTDPDSIAPEALMKDVIVKEAFKEGNSIIIRWDSETTNILGFRVVYRLFGTPEFKQRLPLAPSEREFKILNVPDNVSIRKLINPCIKPCVRSRISLCRLAVARFLMCFILQECIVVCVVSLEDHEINPSNVPYEQCREIRTEGVGGSKRMDNIIIPASTAIVVCVIVAVIIFVACLKSSNKKSKKLLEDKPIHTLSMNGLNMAGLGQGPVAPLAGLASLGLAPHQKDWDQLSMYSQKTDRSVNRARMYHMDPRQGNL